MGLNRKVREAINLISENGLKALIVLAISKYQIPISLSQKFKWTAGIESEIRFWENWFKTKGSRWTDEYYRRIDPNLPLQQRPLELLPFRQQVQILDVGAGPLTVLGKKCNEKNLFITAVDPLAEEYDRILEKYNINPLIRTQKLDAECLTKKFHSDTFDLVFASNAIDHTYNPEKAILQMIEVTKSNCYILLEHAVNEAEHENYTGFHQWNFSMSAEGEFLISSKSRQVNMTKEYWNLADFTCEVTSGNTLITRIYKK